MKTCRTCNAELYRRNKSGLCRVCVAFDPETQQRRKDGQRRAYQQRPELLVAATDRLRATTKTPEHAARARKMMVEGRLWERGVAAKGAPGSEVNQRIGRSVSNARLAHIPPELRADYRRLVQIKGFSAAEAQQIIAEQHEMQMARWRREIGADQPKKRNAPAPAAVKSKPALHAAEALPVPILPHMPLFDRAIALAANETGIAPSLMLGRGRSREIVRARWIVFNVLRAAGRSLPTIARMCGHKDHSTILHGLRETENTAHYHPDFAKALRSVMAACEPFIVKMKAAGLAEAA